MQYPGQVSGSSSNTLTRYPEYRGEVIKIPGLGFAQAHDNTSAAIRQAYLA